MIFGRSMAEAFGAPNGDLKKLSSRKEMIFPACHEYNL